MIKADKTSYPDTRNEIFLSFHDTLLSSYQQALSGPKHILMKMYSFWEYFILSFPSDLKKLKKIKKARSLSEYREMVKMIINEEAF